MSRFALDTLGFWPTYPGHPCTLIRHVRRGTMTPDAAIQWGVDGWREQRLGGDHRARYEEGVAEEAKVLPLLREALTVIGHEEMSG